MTSERPQLWVDFDGTAVTGIDPRHMPRYPFRVMPGFRNFLAGVNLPRDGQDDTEPRVEVAGILTMRPPIFGLWTALELRLHRLSDTFPNRNLVHIGNERAKANFLVARSERANVGMLEDGPHRLAPEILKELSTQRNLAVTAERSILLGAVEHDRSQEYTDKLLRWSKRNLGGLAIGEFEYRSDETTVSIGYRFKIGHAILDVVQLAHYSEAAGESFGRRLIEGS